MEKSHISDPTFLPFTYTPEFHGPLENNHWLAKMPYRPLGITGLNVSLLSYGGSSLGQFYGDEIDQKSIESVRNCIKSGVNYIDTSPWYGDSEALLGQALTGVPRNSYYIGTKVGRNFTPGWENRFDFSRSAILKNVENSLKLLGVSYVDIIQIHDLEFCLEPEIIFKETLPALESVVKAGKARFIGITSYSLEAMKQAVKNSPIKIDTVLSYSRMNFHDIALLDYVPFFESEGVGIINASPVAMGLYTTRGPPNWHPASDNVKKLTETVKSQLHSEGSSIEDVSLGFALRPEPQSISTTLVSMPNDDILQHNLKIVTAPTTVQDRKKYGDIINIFKNELGSNKGHWEGVELLEYKKAIEKC